MRMVHLNEPLSAPRLQLWLHNGETFWLFAVAAGLLTFLTTYITPHVL